MPKYYSKTLRLETEVLDDLDLVKRVLGTKSRSDTVRKLMDARGYDRKWFKHMNEVLDQEAEIGVVEE